MRDIILRYKAIYSGFFNYYRFADNIKQIRKVYWILKESLKKTLSIKYKVGQRLLLKKHGKYLEANYSTSKGITKSIKFYFPIPTINPIEFGLKMNLKDPPYMQVSGNTVNN